MHRSAKIHRLNQPSTYDTVYRMHNYSFIIHHSFISICTHTNHMRQHHVTILSRPTVYLHTQLHEKQLSTAQFRYASGHRHCLAERLTCMQNTLRNFER